MKITLNEHRKINIFISLCALLKKSNSIIRMVFDIDHLYIQGMDKCNICLYDIKIYSNWFSCYEPSLQGVKEVVSVDLNTLHLILSLYKEGNELTFSFDDESEEITIAFDKDDSNKTFVIPLINYEIDYMSIPESSYNVEIKLKSKKICDLTTQLLLFGDNLNLDCFDEKISFNTSGEKGKMNAYINYDEMIDYNLNIEDDIKTTFSLNLLNKLCLSTNLSEDITLFISDKYPMKIKYMLDEEVDDSKQSYIEFYIAPKINDD
jgi:proliferating cell nuclear antigen PCNA